MKKRRLSILLILLVICSSCSTNSTSSEDKETQALNEFWKITQEALDKHRDDQNRADKGDLTVGIVDPSMENEDGYQDFAARYTIDEDTEVSYALQHLNAHKYIAYGYKKNHAAENDMNTIYNDHISIQSTDTNYQEYSIQFDRAIYRNSAFLKTQELTGTIIVTNGKISHFDNVPLLKEAVDALTKLVDNFQRTYDIDYSKVTFVDLPKLLSQENIEDIKEVPEELSTTINYYSTPHINAKGYQLITSVELQKDYSSVSIGVYNVERKSFDEGADWPIEMRSDNVYQTVAQGDAIMDYAFYIDGSTLYLYDKNLSDEQIINDIASGATNAISILSTENPSYQS